jgi:hypothetical protein
MMDAVLMNTAWYISTQVEAMRFRRHPEYTHLGIICDKRLDLNIYIVSVNVQ